MSFKYAPFVTWMSLRSVLHNTVFSAKPNLSLAPLHTHVTVSQELKVCAEACGDNGNAESLEQVQGLLCPLYSQLERFVQGPDAPLHLKRRLV